MTLIEADTPATPTELREVSATNLVITGQVIDAIRNQDNETQGLSITRLAQDTALQNLVDEAFMLRRVLLAGAKAQPIANLKPAQDNINIALQHLTTEINDLLSEHDIRQKMLTNSLQVVLSTESVRQAKAMQHSNETGALPITQGAVYQNK
jgi:hypothetical protein